MKVFEIKLWGTYSNGEFGNRWAVRQVLTIEACDGERERDQVIFKVLVGPGRRAKGSCTRAEFLRWVRYEVVRNESSWERTTSPAWRVVRVFFLRLS